MRAAALLLALPLAACRSPFAEADETGPPEDPAKVGVGVHGWPLYERAPGSRGVRTDVLWPLASLRTSESGDLYRADVLVPIVLWEQDGTRRRFGVRPLFDVETDDAPGAAVEDVDLLFPIVKWREAPEESRFEVRPFWWHLCKPGQRRNLLLPLWGEWERGEDGGWFAGPFAGGGREGTRSTDWWALGAAIHETDTEATRDSWKVLLGLGEKTTWDDGGEERVFPLLWHGADASEERDEWLFLWPGLVGRRCEGDRSQSWALPVWYSRREGETETTVIFPLWASHREEGTSLDLLFPVYGRLEIGTKDWRSYGGNLLITSSDEEAGEGTADLVWPLMHWGTDPGGWDAHLFPLVWLDRHEERSHTHVWPLFGHRRDGQETELSSVWPLFVYEEEEEGWNAHAFPLVWLDRHGEHSHTHVWPLFGHRRDGTETEVSTVWPFFTWEDGDDGWTANLPWPLVEIDRRGKRHETRVFPLFAAESEPETGAYEGNVLWLLSNWEGDGAGKGDFRILWRLVQATDTGEKSVVAVNPFFRHETNDRGDVHWSALFGLIARTREAEEVRWRLLWFLEL